MSFFEDASLVLIPSAQKTSKVYSVKPTDGTGDLTFTRSNDTATRVGPDGLIEKVRTNLILQSETFDNASWGKTTATVTANTTTAPNGTTTADTFDSTGSFAFLSQSPTLASGSLATYSVYIKNIDAPYVNLQVRSTITAGLARFDFTGATLTGSTLTTGISASFTDVGSGWYRCTLTCTTSEVNQQYRIQLPNSGDSVFLWGAMAEVGDVMTDYIATTTAAVSVGPVANVPRLDYLGSSCPRLILEPQRQNLALFSESFNNAAWTTFRASVTANAATSPDGYSNADKIIDTIDNDSHGVFQSVANTSGQQYSVSVFAKAAERSFLTINITGGPSQGSFFDLSNGTIGSIISFAPNARSIEDYGNGWYRCSITYTATDGASNISIGTAISDGVLLYAGDGTSGIFAYGCQTELGAYPTSYVPTLGAAVTRGQDQAEKASISSLIGATEGTMFVDILFTGAADNNPAYIQTWASQSERMGLFYSISANLIRPYLVASGETDFSLGFTPTAGTRYKMAFCYKANDYAFFVNGSQVTIDTRAAVPTAGTKLFVGCLDSATQPNRQFSNINQALLFPTRLSNSSLAELTSL